MRIKQIPEDFCVEEIIELETKPEGDHTYFWLTKTNWTTVRAITEIAKACRISKRRLKFAGTKDKVAITRQAVSAFKVEPETLKKIKLKDIKIEIIGKGEQQISMGDLIGNSFTIIVRDLEDKELVELPERIKAVKKFGFPNYFGVQRFGGGNTHLVGREILKGNLWQAVKLILTFVSPTESLTSKAAREFTAEHWGQWKDCLKLFPKFLSLEKAVLNWLIKHPTDFGGALRVIPKPTRRMYVHSFQSWIFNRALAQLLKENSEVREVAFVDTKITFPTYKKKDESLFKELLNKELPVPGSKTQLGKDTFSQTIALILEEENIKLEDFSCARMPEIGSEGVSRAAFILPKDFKSSKPDKDNLNKGKKKIKLLFELLKGAYATVLLKVLFD